MTFIRQLELSKYFPQIFLIFLWKPDAVVATLHWCDAANPVSASYIKFKATFARVGDRNVTVSDAEHRLFHLPLGSLWKQQIVPQIGLAIWTKDFQRRKSLVVFIVHSNW